MNIQQKITYKEFEILSQITDPAELVKTYQITDIEPNSLFDSKIILQAQELDTTNQIRFTKFKYANMVFSIVVGFFGLIAMVLLLINNLEGLYLTYKIARPLVFVASSVFGVFYLMWLHNAYKTYIATNESANFAQPTRKQTPAGAVWSHFLPINNLYAPFLILNEMQNNKRGGYINKNIWLTWFAPIIIPCIYLVIYTVCFALPIFTIIDFVPEVVGILAFVAVSQGVLFAKLSGVLGIIALGGSYLISNWFLYQTVFKIHQKQTELLKIENTEIQEEVVKSEKK